MSRLQREEEDQQSPREKQAEFDDDNSLSKGYTSIYRKKQSTPIDKSKIYIALILLAFFVFIWSYSSKTDEPTVGNKALDEQLHKAKDARIQSLEASNKLFRDKIEERNKEIKRLKEELIKVHPELTDNPKQDSKEIVPVKQNQETRKDKPVADEDKFVVPKIVWLYLNRPASQENYVTQRSIENKKWYAQKSGFELRIVDTNNYRLWLNSEQTVKVDGIIKDLQNKRGHNQQINSKFQKLRQNIIMLHLLYRFGGVVIGKHYIFTENLDWLQTIKSNILVNTGNPYAKPKVFTFFSISEGTTAAKHNKKTSIEVQKYFIISPGPKDYFIAALAGTQYIGDLLTQYIEIALNPGQIVNIMSKDSVTCGKMNSNDLNGAFTLASHIIVQRKQNQLNRDQAKFEGSYDKFAIDQYGLFSINAYYFPDKMWFYFTNRLRLFNNFFNYAAKMAQDQFQDSIGPMRYIANPDPHGEFNPRLESVRDGKGYMIIEGSFMQRHLFMDKKYDFITPNRQKRNTAIFKKWENLPKTLWLYWDRGSQNASVTNQLCILSLIKNAKAAGYQVKEVNDANAHQYIPKQTLDLVTNGIKNAKMNILPQTKSDFYRLALISTHGGIYLDSSYFFLEDFTWITEVSKEPTKYYFNRFGDVPKVLMQFHPIEGGPLDWTVDQTYNTKATWHLAFESNFLAADKDSEFIKDWFQMFRHFVGSSYSDTETKMRQCSMYDYKWTNNYDRYLTVMDALKAVLGCKQNDINNNKDKYGKIVHAADYYKLWGFNGFTGIQKFRFYNNYANAYNGIVNEDNLLLYRYSQQYAELVYGRVYKTIKLYGFNIGTLNNVINNQRQTEFKFQCHPDSFFLKYLYNKDEHQFTTTNGLHVRLKT